MIGIEWLIVAALGLISLGLIALATWVLVAHAMWIAKRWRG